MSSTDVPDVIANSLLAVGYAVSVAILTRWLAVVRERRWRWFLAHEAAVAAIVAGWALRGRRPGAALNGAWMVAAAVWYFLGGRRR